MIRFVIVALLSVTFTASLSLAEPTTKPTTKPAAKPKAPRTPESSTTEVPRNMFRHETFLARIKKGPVGLLFLGDSITDFWPKRGEASWKKFADYKPANFGISGEKTEQILWGISNGELDGIDPKAVVIMIGTNNLGHHGDEKPEWVAAGVEKIVRRVHEKLPNANILLLGIFPRDGAKSDRRAKVNATNEILSKLKIDKMTYLDIGPKFLDEQGNIPKDVMPDALHPNDKGYDIWLDAMWPTLEPMLK
jgi:beta-glucosidase